jgi:hypothetical protein
MLSKLKYTKEPYGQTQFAIQLEDHKYSDIRFTIGKISFNEVEDNFTLKYDYDIIENNSTEFDKKEFEHVVGDLIMQMLEEGVQKNDLIYTGGVDEN